MTKIRLPVGLKLITCKITETASITKTPPTTTSSSSCLQQIATTPIVPPRESVPVSLTNTDAGKQMNQKNQFEPGRGASRPPPPHHEKIIHQPQNNQKNHAKQDQPNEAVNKPRPDKTGQKDRAQYQDGTHGGRSLLAAVQFGEAVNL